MLAFMAFLPVLTPGQASAYEFTQPDIGYNADTKQWSGDVCPGEGFLRRLMPCIKETLLNVTNKMLVELMQYATNTILVMCVLAIALLGMLMIGGKTTAPFKDTLMLMMKLGCIALFMENFGIFFSDILDAMDYLLGIVTQYVLIDVIDDSAVLSCKDYVDSETANQGMLIWDAADCGLNTLIGGILEPNGLTLKMGIIGFLQSSLFSNTLGMAIGLLGIRIVIQLIWALFRCLYIFVGSYIGICLMVLIAPFFVPTILFQVTRGHFDRWLRTFLSFIIQPVILFAYIGMLLTAFDLVIFSGPHSLYGVLAGSAADDPKFRMSTADGGSGNIGTWLETNGAYIKDYKSPIGIDINSKGTKKAIDEASNRKNNNSEMHKGNADTGVMGVLSTIFTQPESNASGMNIKANEQRHVLKSLGLGEVAALGGKNDLNLFEMNIPKETVDWEMLAWRNGYDVSDGDTEDASDGSVVRYMIKVYISLLMSLLTGFIFIELLDTLPFIGSRLAMGSSIVDEKTLGMKGLAKMAPPGADFVKNIKGRSFMG